MTDDGGAAFPLPPCPQCGTDHEPTHREAGMSLRDWFAGMALSSVMREPRTRQWLPEVLATEAYAVADAMLAARKEVGGEE